MNPTPESIKANLAAQINCVLIEVDGDGQHFEAKIVSDDFVGLTRIERHQLVYRALGERMKAEIHALSFKTFTVAEWQKN